MRSSAHPFATEITIKLVKKITKTNHLTCLNIVLRTCNKLKNIYLRKFMESWQEQWASEAFELRLCSCSSFQLCIAENLFQVGTAKKKCRGSLFHQLLVVWLQFHSSKDRLLVTFILPYSSVFQKIYSGWALPRILPFPSPTLKMDSIYYIGKVNHEWQLENNRDSHFLPPRARAKTQMMHLSDKDFKGYQGQGVTPEEAGCRITLSQPSCSIVAQPMEADFLQNRT